MRPSSRSDFTIAIFCALPLEADAVEAIFDDCYDRLGKYYGKHQGDMNSYINGRIGKHNVVVCYMPGIGTRSAASVTSNLLISYENVKLALVVGICGGAPLPPDYQDIFLGDVIISDSVIEYDFGRQYPGEYIRKADMKDVLARPIPEIRALLNGLRAAKARDELQEEMLKHLRTLQQKGMRWNRPEAKDVLFNAAYLHKHYERGLSTSCCCLEAEVSDKICEVALEKNCGDLGCDPSQIARQREPLEADISVHIGTVASGNTVMKSGQHREAIARTERIVGFEMEGAGVWDHVPCLIIKGVCDYADSHKNKSWQEYAAATAATTTKAFLAYWRSGKHEDTLKCRHLMIPFGRNPCFVGRQNEIHRLEEIISMPNGTKKLAITGLGGVGKTQVALELSYRVRDRDAECSIFWIPCTSHEIVEQAYMAIAQMVGIPDVKPAEVKERIKDYFSHKEGRWLLIFDNADDMGMWTEGSSDIPPLKDFLPLNNQGHIIFTCRNRELAVDLVSSFVVHLDDFDQKTGVEFLEMSLTRKDPLDDSFARIALLEQLAFLPLAISQATSYIHKKDITVSDYLMLLMEQEADVVKLLSKDFGDDGRYKDMQNPVAKTWLISFHQIQKLDGLAAYYLSLMACVNPRNIPQIFLSLSSSKLQMTDALGLLSAYSFITVHPRAGCVTLHRLVHLATRNWLRNEKRLPDCIQIAAGRLSIVFPSNNHTNRQLWRELLPHALFLLSERDFPQEYYLVLMHNVASCLSEDGRYNEAEKLLVQVITPGKQLLGPEAPVILRFMSNLALVYRMQGRLKDAEELFMQIIASKEKVVGREDSSTLTNMANLAQVYQDQGRWKEAEELQVKQSKLCSDILGPLHPTTLTSMASLASTYMHQERLKEAEELLIQVIASRKQVESPEHPSTLTAMSNLASTYVQQGRLTEAEELLVQVIESEKRVLGLEHPSTLRSMANLASTYFDQRRMKEAEKLEIQVVTGLKQVLGPEHPQTLVDMNTLATIYGMQGRWKEAEELDKQVMESRKQVLGPEHPDTLTSMFDLAVIRKSLGNLQDAVTLMSRCVELRNKILGSDHRQTRSASNMLREWEAENCSSAQQTSQNHHILPVHNQSTSRLHLGATPGTIRRAFSKFLRN